MALFQREDEIPSTGEPSGPAPSPGKKRSATTHISAGSRIDGEITGSTDLRVDGEIDGRLELDNRVVVGETGVVRGEVKARSVQVAGRVEGNIMGSDTVEILRTGRVLGDVSSPRVTIADGAFFKGNVEMLGTPD